MIEHTRYPRNPLDVLAQQIVAMCALDEWKVDELAALVRRAANFAELSDEVFTSVLDLLAGRYPSDEFAELRPRIVWDRVNGIVRGRAGAQRLAVTSGGTIPDRGSVRRLPSRRHPRRRARRRDGVRVARRVRRSCSARRPGASRTSRSSASIVTPAPGLPGKMPFWHGDGPGRPLELGRAVGSFVRDVRSWGDGAAERLRDDYGLDELAAGNLVQYLDDQAEATGVVPDDRTIVVERFRDEIGDWRVCVLSPFGAQVHAPWAMALQARLPDRWGIDVELLWSDDGIVLRLPEAIDELPVDELLIDPDDIDELVIAQLPNSALFASRFRECAARALLLPRRRPDRRTPLWQQRQKAADLLTVAARHPTFPILLETTRECVNDVFDLPALREVLTELRSRAIRVVPVDTPRASPFAQSLLFSWISVYMYEGDTPLAERRAAALALDRDLLRDLLGAEELRELLDPAVLADLELELQHLVEGRRARDADELHDLLRLLGPLTLTELDARAEPAIRRRGSISSCNSDEPSRCRLPARRASPRQKMRPGFATRSASRCPSGFPPRSPTRSTIRCAISWPVTPARTGRSSPRRWRSTSASAIQRVLPPLEALERDGRIVRGEFRPDGVEREWCDDDVLRQLRRRSLAALRKEVEPVDGARARPVPACVAVGGVETTGRRRCRRRARHVVGRGDRGVGAREPTCCRLASPSTAPADLDALCTSGDVVWVGAGGLGANDGRMRLVFRDQAPMLVPPPADIEPSPTHQALLDHLGNSGRVVLARAVAGRCRGGPSVRRRRSARRPVGSRVGRPRHQRLAGARAGDGRRQVRHDGAPSVVAEVVRVPAGWRGSAHLRQPDGGRSSRRCSSPRRRRRRRRIAVPCSCSSATASSPARRRWPKASRAGSRACIRS